MNKQPDFGNDLAALNDNVTAEVGDVLRVLEQKRTATRPVIVRKAEESTAAVQNTVDAETAREEPAAAKPPRGKREPSRPRIAPAIEKEEVWKSITTRLRIETVELLKEACLRQELKKKSPHTGQAIIDEALGDWFRKHGYGRGSDKASDD